VWRGRARLFGLRYDPATHGQRSVPYFLFGLTPLLYIAQQLLTHTRAILGGEMYAEMSSNYYATTQMYGARLQLLAIDAGYIPLPQRIIGLVGWWLGLPPSAIPYYYTGTALVLSALLVGAICLPPFRALIANDYLRFALSAAILLVLDFETRGYINFTYLVVVPAAFISALALVGGQVPRWAWFLPILMISKPGVLTALPMIIVAALVSTRRFRIMAAVSTVAAVVQVIRLAISSTLPGSLLQQGASTSLFDKIVVAVQYTLGFIGRFVLAPAGAAVPGAEIASGTIVLVIFLVVALVSRSKASAAIFAGLSLVAADMLLNAVVYPVWFNTDLSMTVMVGFDRRVVVAEIGALVALAGVVAVVTESPLVWAGLDRATRLAANRLRPAIVPVLRTAAVLLFIAWFVIVGWMRYSAGVNAPNVAPSTDVSKWEAMAPALASGQPVVCIPTAPFGWSAYGRGCESLGAGVPASLDFQPVKQQTSGAWSTSIPVPEGIRGRALAATEVLVQPTQADQLVHATLTVTTSSGSKNVFIAADRLPLTGGSMLFEHSPADLLKEPESVTVAFDAPVRIGWVPDGAGGEGIAVHWMGQ
jgi:hypothetical protein